MSRSLTYIWPASNKTDVCNQQSTTGAANLVLNGNLANQVNTAVPFINYGYSRTVTISAAATDLSGRTFTINGTQNGANISNQRTGPAANSTVESTASFDIITSISVDGVAVNVTVGSGYQGFMKLIGLNLERDVINYALSTAKLTTVTIPTTLYQIFSDIEGNGQLFSNIVTSNSNVFSINNATNDQYVLPFTGASAIVSPICKSWLLQIRGTSGTAANSIQLNFIQT